MIQRVGVIYQDANSLGFLEGLKDRLGCKAELIPPPTAIGTTRVLPRKSFKWAWEYFQKKGVDLVVRLTDADTARWQDIRRTEMERAPEGTQGVWICAVAVECTEDWLALAPNYLSEVLEINLPDLKDEKHRIGVVKKGLLRAKKADEQTTDVVRRIVREAPRDVAKVWLKDDSLRHFYFECRAAAARAECKTPNELEPVDAE